MPRRDYFNDPARPARLDIHPFVRLRIEDALAGLPHPYIG